MMISRLLHLQEIQQTNMKDFRIRLLARTIFLTLSIILFSYVLFKTDLIASLIIIGALIIYQVFSLWNYLSTTNKEIARFLLSIRYSDFSQSFSRPRLGGSFKELNDAFNEVIAEFQKTRTEKEEHFRFLQTVIQHVGVGLISFNQLGKIEFINNAAKKILKISVLNNIEGLNKISEGFGTHLSKMEAGEKSTIRIFDEEEVVQLIVVAAEFRMRNQKYSLISLQNIQSELEEKEMEAWQKLIRVLTHEIMNSVTPISSLAGTVNEMLGREDKDDETISDIKIAIDTIRKRSEGLIRFVDNYRSLTHVPKPEFSIFSVSDLFERVRKLMDNTIQSNAIKFDILVEPKSLELTADAELIEQVLLNLILNSIYFLKNMEAPIIRLAGQLDERGKTVIKVTDNGPGISEDLLDKIFIPFFSTKKDGSGIGLSLSRQIMRIHAGSMRIYSRPYNETTVLLRF